ncbi:Hypothetical protein SCLAV_p0206 (plasmid) [Streptomyces clavuligerus]|uniref:Uncharacterized protein n=1 Tax=Streptomyces clavuligerus TaxID=1901 RepID=B5GUI7_STRCL|nr:hypothetical protein SSCG_03237 [Streptomyces clavuligerus]EFG03697.1 Hypothetical protein SCLAV_p0206 [Streptomyces clavuligerus]
MHSTHSVIARTTPARAGRMSSRRRRGSGTPNDPRAGGADEGAQALGGCAEERPPRGRGG